jgi:hypothetical protein
MRANSVGKSCSEVDLAYVAGFVDGDGAIMACIEPHREKKFGFRVRIVLKVTQKHKKDLIFLEKMFGCGHVRPNSTTFDWILRDQQSLKLVLESLLPYSRSKRQQIKLALQILHTKIVCMDDLLQVATLADTLSRFNVRSNNRRKNYVAMIQEHFSSND